MAIRPHTQMQNWKFYTAGRWVTSISKQKKVIIGDKYFQTEGSIQFYLEAIVID